MKSKSVAFSIIVAVATSLLSQAHAADVCKQSEIEYTKLKSEYEDCIRNTPGKFKEHNAACIKIKTKITDTQAQGNDCRMIHAVNKALALSDNPDAVRAKYRWQSEK